MEYDASGLVSRRHRGRTFNEVVSAYQRDIADLDQDGSTTDYVSLTPLYDGAYDCIGILDHTGAIAESYVHTYDGAVTITNSTGGTISTSAVGWQQGYGRMYRDSESGLNYAVNRYYAPATGRFISEDPLGRWFDAANYGNGLAWVANRYRNAWDPLGLRPEETGKPPGAKPWDRLTAEERQEIAQRAALGKALNNIANFGPDWARDLLKRRWWHFDWPSYRKRGFNGWGFQIKEVPEGTGDCTNSRTGTGEITIDPDSITDSDDYWENFRFLAAIYHELLHDYYGFDWKQIYKPNNHPPIPGLGVGEGTGGYNDAAERFAEETLRNAGREPPN